MSIENPTLAHFRHFSSLFTYLPSTSVEDSLQIDLFMQNKPNVKSVQINVSSFITSIYVKVDNWCNQKNKPNSNPILSAVGGLPKGQNRLPENLATPEQIHIGNSGGQYSPHSG